MDVSRLAEREAVARPEEEILIYVMSQHVACLIPKQRGRGFLRIPLGHHHNAGLARIAIELGFDIFGLDGSLDVQTGYGGADYVAAIGAAISEHYKKPWRLICREEFYLKHPIAGPQSIATRNRLKGIPNDHT